MMNKDILEKIRLLRKQSKLTQEELGLLIGCAKETYRDIENGKIPLKMETYLKICKALRIDPDVLVRGSNKIIIGLTDEQTEVLLELFDQISKQKQLQQKISFNSIHDINSSGGDILIGSNIKKIK